jgi:hypothetical protein
VLARFLKEKLTCPLPSSIPIPPPADLAAKFPGLRLLPLQLPIRNPVLLITDELLVQLEPGTVQDLRE